MCIHLILAKRPGSRWLAYCRVLYMLSGGDEKQLRTESVTGIDQVARTVALKMTLIPHPLVSVLKTQTRLLNC